jgi:hypothetical protein
MPDLYMSLESLAGQMPLGVILLSALGVYLSMSWHYCRVDADQSFSIAKSP